MGAPKSRTLGVVIAPPILCVSYCSPVRVEDLIADLSARYQAPSGVIERDLLHLLGQLADEGLIKIS